MPLLLGVMAWLRKVHINTKTKSLLYYVWIYYTLGNDILNWLVLSGIRSLMKQKKESFLITGFSIFCPALVIF